MSQQKRRDDVSAKLGSLLLKGYKMLAEACVKCGNVLMQDKKGVVICVNCNEAEHDPGSNNVIIDSPAVGIAHQLPDRGYSDGIPYRALASMEGPPEAACYAEGVLLREIKTVALHLEKYRLRLDGEDNSERLKDRVAHLEYIRQCSETIKSLQGIRM